MDDEKLRYHQKLVRESCLVIPNTKKKHQTSCKYSEESILRKANVGERTLQNAEGNC